MTDTIDIARLRLRAQDLHDQELLFAGFDVDTILSLCAEVERLRAERDRDVAALGDDVAGRTMIQDLRVQNGGLEAVFSGGASGLLAQAFIDAIDAHSAANYLEVSFHSEKHGPIVVTTQKVGGKTPATLRKEAEQERDALRAELEKARADSVMMFSALRCVVRVFPTDYDMVAAGWSSQDVEDACAAYEGARSIVQWRATDKARAAIDQARAAQQGE